MEMQYLINNSYGTRQNAFDVFQPQRAVNGRQPLLIIICRETDLFQFPQTLAHYVNVMNVQEDHFNILIGILSFVTGKHNVLQLLCSLPFMR